MINYLKRADLDVEKYDDCIENSIQSKIYAFSWYLDIACKNWDVLVLNDYEAVMPIPWKKKLGIKYVYPPFWILELGIFSLSNSINIDDFLEEANQYFKYIESYLNTDNNVGKNPNLKKRTVQKLPLQSSYETILKAYRKDRKKDLRRAKEYLLKEKWNDNPENLITLFKENVGLRTPKIGNKDYDTLLNIIQTCISKGVGEILSIYNPYETLVASAFLVKHKETVTILVSSTDFNNRKNGANTFLIDSAIFKYCKEVKVFNFGGSSIKSIANYFLSFGAETEEYYQIKSNKLSKLLTLFKK